MTDPVQPPDPDRRRFFRQFAGDVVTSVGSVLGAAQSLQQTSAEAARELLGNGPLIPASSGALPANVELDASTAGFRAPFRWDGNVCRIVDQRRLPDVLVDLDLRTAADTVNAINDGAILGAAVQAQLGAVTLAIMASGSATSRPFARRATIRGAANALRLTRSGSAAMNAAMDRMLALVEALGLDADGPAISDALTGEAERIIAETTDDHGAVVLNALGVLPGEPESALRLMVAGSTGAMGGGQFGTALSVVQTVHHAQRPIHAIVPEGRPTFAGSRIAAWELRQAGVSHSITSDAAASTCIAGGEVHAVLVGADRIAANGDVVSTVGTYPLALAAAAAGIPFLVCAATTAIDGSVADGGSAIVEEGRPTLLLRAGGTRVAPDGSLTRNPVQDLTPAGLVTAIVTETGILRAPYGPAIAEALATAATRRSASAGFAALQAQRAEAARIEAEAAARIEAEAAGRAEAAADAASGDAAPGDGERPAIADAPAAVHVPVDVAALRAASRTPDA